MPNGTIKFFNAAKKFGFVTPDEGGKDVFVPVASLAAAGISALKAGQRVSFETAPDGKGPKVVNLALIESPPSPPPAANVPKSISKEEGRAQFTFYHDPAYDWSREVLAELRAAGLEMREVDYVATPPDREELKRLSMLLRDGDGSLVRKYDPLFHDLRLDDRFISQNEFWDGIVENPTLINGPVIATANSANLFRSDDAVKQFLASVLPGRRHVAVEKKSAVEFAAPPATEAGAAKFAAADDEASQPENAPAESAAPATDGTAGKKAKAAPKAKGKVNAEPAAEETVKKAVRKAVQKPRSTKAK
jgi:CspA family cold shock protein